MKAGTKHGIAVGNTPGVLTETTAELALALTFAAARRVVEGDKFMRAGLYKGWLPTLFVGARPLRIDGPRHQHHTRQLQSCKSQCLPNSRCRWPALQQPAKRTASRQGLSDSPMKPGESPTWDQSQPE